MRPELEKLAVEHRAATTNKERARIESEAAAIITPEDRKHYKSLRDVLAHLFSSKEYEIEARRVIYSTGVYGDQVWDKIERKEIPLRTAAGLCQKAKTVPNTHLHKAIEELLREYDELPYVSTLNGVTFRRSSPTRGAELAEIKDPADWWELMRLDVIPDQSKLDIPAAKIILQRMEKEFKISIDICRRDIEKAVQHSEWVKSKAKSKELEVARKKMMDACVALHMDVPSGSEIPDIERARKQMHRLARMYHPDANAGDEKNIPQYYKVLEAYDTIEKFIQQHNRGTR